MCSWLPTKGTLLLSSPGARSTLGATLKAGLSTRYVLADGCTLSVLLIHGDFAFCLGLGLSFGFALRFLGPFGSLLRGRVGGVSTRTTKHRAEAFH